MGDAEFAKWFKEEWDKVVGELKAANVDLSKIKIRKGP